MGRVCWAGPISWPQTQARLSPESGISWWDGWWLGDLAWPQSRAWQLLLGCQLGCFGFPPWGRLSRSRLAYTWITWWPGSSKSSKRLIPRAQVFSKSPFASCVLSSHWSKQVTWLRQVGSWREGRLRVLIRGEEFVVVFAIYHRTPGREVPWHSWDILART